MEGSFAEPPDPPAEDPSPPPTKKESWLFHWLKEHKDAVAPIVASLALLSSISYSVLAYFVARDARDATDANSYLNVSKSRAILAFEDLSTAAHAKRYVGPGTHFPDTLLIYNLGEQAMQRPQFEVQTIVVFAYRDSIGASDRHQRLPLKYWYARHKHQIGPTGKGLIFTMGGEDNTAGLRLWTWTSAPAESVPARRIANVVQLLRVRYRDVLEDDQTDYYLVSPWDYARISEQDGDSLWAECQARMDAKPRPYEVNIANQVGRIMDTDSLADVAATCPIPEYAMSNNLQVEPDSIRLRGYPPKHSLEFRQWRKRH